MPHDYHYEETDEEHGMTLMEKQMNEDIRIEMAKQGVSSTDFSEGIDPAIFVDVNIYTD